MSQFREALLKNGYVWGKNQSFEKFTALVSSLGTVFHTTEVRLQPGSTQYALRPEQFDMHMDNPDADYAAWYIRNDGGDASCPMVIADSREAVNSLPADVLHGLEQTETLYIDATTLKRLPIPLVARDENGIYYARYFPYDVRRIKPRDETQAAHIRALEACLASLPKMILPIETGDIVILDNRRMLHGRRQLRTDSARHLFRAWVNCAGKYRGLVWATDDAEAQSRMEA
jgi:hypothetical protein